MTQCLLGLGTNLFCHGATKPCNYYEIDVGIFVNSRRGKRCKQSTDLNLGDKLTMEVPQELKTTVTLIAGLCTSSFASNQGVALLSSV